MLLFARMPLEKPDLMTEFEVPIFCDSVSQMISAYDNKQ